jgi:uncharacterized protein YbjT (DUF2867 family)
MRILITGTSGYVGSRLAVRLARDGHDLRGLSRSPDRPAPPGVKLLIGEAVSGHGLAAALEGVEVAYFLIHSMEPSGEAGKSEGARRAALPFSSRERLAAENFAAAADAAGVRKVIYLGGLIPVGGRLSAHLASRLAVEEVLADAVPCPIAFRASIVIGAGSRSFRFLVRLVERLPVLTLPAWHSNRTNPIDERDMVELLARAAASDAVCRRTLDVGGPDTVTYEELIDRIRDHMLIDRGRLRFRRLGLTPVASRVAAAIAGEQHELIGPLMESLEADLVPRDRQAAELLGVRLHSLDAAIEHALCEWEGEEPLAAR